MDFKIQTVYNKDFNVNWFKDNDGELWFVAKTVAQELGYSIDGGMTKYFAHVPDFWKGGKRISTPGGMQEMLCLKEQGLYFFLSRSDKPKALPFQMWISGEVVPAIRKHGLYATPAKVEDILANPDAFIGVLQAYKLEREKRIALEAKAEEDRPKVIFADALEISNESILIGNLAKILRQNGIDIGQNRLFQWLRDNGFLIKCKGERWNMPTQDAIERGLFEIKTRTINDSKGVCKVVRTTKVTPKGQIFFVNKLIEIHNIKPVPLDAKADGANA